MSNTAPKSVFLENDMTDSTAVSSVCVFSKTGRTQLLDGVRLTCTFHHVSGRVERDGHLEAGSHLEAVNFSFMLDYSRPAPAVHRVCSM